MAALTRMFSASVAWRDQVAMKTASGSTPRSAAAVPAASCRSAATGQDPARRLGPPREPVDGPAVRRSKRRRGAAHDAARPHHQMPCRAMSSSLVSKDRTWGTAFPAVKTAPFGDIGTQRSPPCRHDRPTTNGARIARRAARSNSSPPNGPAWCCTRCRPATAAARGRACCSAALPGISKKMLTQTLREMEGSGLVSRHVSGSVPPAVTYALTPLGIRFVEAAGTALRLGPPQRGCSRPARESACGAARSGSDAKRGPAPLGRFSVIVGLSGRSGSSRRRTHEGRSRVATGSGKLRRRRRPPQGRSPAT